MLDTIPSTRKVAAKTLSPTRWKCCDAGPHSVHQIFASGRPCALEDRPQVQRRAAVGVRRQEVDRRTRRGRVVEQQLDPLGRGRARSPDDEPLVDLAHRGDRDVVQPQVLLLRAAPEDVEVRLVPDLEAPALADLLDAVAVDEVRGEVGDQVGPPVPVLRRRDDRLVGEDGASTGRWRGRAACRTARPPAAGRSRAARRRPGRCPRSRAPARRRPRGRRRGRRRGSRAPAPSARRARRASAAGPRSARGRSTRPPTSSVDSSRLRCSDPIIGRHGRSQPADDLRRSTTRARRRRRPPWRRRSPPAR